MFQRRVKRNSKARLREVKEKARLIFVPVGKNLDMDALYTWASFPPEYNILEAKGSCGCSQKTYVFFVAFFDLN